MKVILTSNFNLDTIADQLVEGNLTKEEAQKVKDQQNLGRDNNDTYWAVIVEDTYRLKRGMQDLC